MCMRCLFYVLMCRSLSAPTRVRQSQIRMQTNELNLYLLCLCYDRLSVALDGKRGTERKRHEKLNVFRSVLKFLKRIYQTTSCFEHWVKMTIIFFILILLFTCSATQCKHLFEMKCVTFLLTLILISGYVPYFLFIRTILRFSLCSMTFEKYVKFWHIPTYPLNAYVCLYTMMDGDHLNSPKCMCVQVNSVCV